VKRGQLTERQQRFVEAYTGPARGNASEAARMAGYRTRQEGPRLLSNAVIAAAICERAGQTRQEAIMGSEEAQRTLTEIARSTVEEAKDRIAAIKEIAKMRGYYAPKKLDHAYSGLSDAELAARLEEARKALGGG
jgi:phage terminase small subunit